MHSCFINAHKRPLSDSCLDHAYRAQEDVASWGHEYIRSLSGEIGEEYHARREKGEDVDDLLGLVAQIVPFHMTHNAGKLLQFLRQRCTCHTDTACSYRCTCISIAHHTLCTHSYIASSYSCT